MNYGQVKSQFTGLMNRRDLTANPSLVDTFCQQALSRAQRTLRVPAMEKCIALTWDASYSGSNLPIPTDLLELKEIIYSDSCTAYTLREFPISIVKREAILIDPPNKFARQGSNWVLAPTPQIGNALQIDYYAEFPALTSDTSTNWVTDLAPDLIAYGALSFAADYYKDPRAPQFEGRFQQAMEELQSQADDGELTVGAAVAPTYLFED